VGRRREEGGEGKRRKEGEEMEEEKVKGRHL
jgi:hypothetical protein